MTDTMYFFWSWTPVLVLSVLAVGFKQSALALSVYGTLFSLVLTVWVFQTPVSVALMAGLDGVLTTFPLLLVIIAGILLSQLLMSTGSLARIVNWFMQGVTSVFLRNLLITIGVGNFMEGASVIAEPVVAPMLRASGVSPIGSAALSIVGYSGLMTLELSGMILAVHSLITGLPIQTLAIASAWLSIPATLMMAACIPFFLKGSEDDGIDFGRQLVLSLGSGLIASVIALMTVYLAGPSLSGMLGGLGLILILVRVGIRKMAISRQIWLDLSPFVFMMAALFLVNTIPFLKTLTFERLRFSFQVIPVHTLMLTPFFSAYLYLFLSAALAVRMFGLSRTQISQVIRAGFNKGWRASLSMALFGAMGQIIALKQQPIDNNIDTARLGSIALQDIIKAQPLVLLGLISNITGIALQDDMAITIRRLLQLGLDIANPSTHSKGEKHGIKTAHLSAAGPAGTQTVQLAGSPSGP